MRTTMRRRTATRCRQKCHRRETKVSLPHPKRGTRHDDASAAGSHRCFVDHRDSPRPSSSSPASSSSRATSNDTCRRRPRLRRNLSTPTTSPPRQTDNRADSSSSTWPTISASSPCCPSRTSSSPSRHTVPSSGSCDGRPSRRRCFTNGRDGWPSPPRADTAPCIWRGRGGGGSIGRGIPRKNATSAARRFGADTSRPRRVGSTPRRIARPWIHRGSDTDVPARMGDASVTICSSI
mmetsp:Transcript_2779/g.6624  ORF Transcript_2779/g.6624 Transcript_2779/m.6624 type:complete len:236 (+) Transcript_2779:602-1309(+)